MFDAGDDAHNHLEITERGKAYLAYSSQLEETARDRSDDS
jgi:hypothetical protein